MAGREEDHTPHCPFCSIERGKVLKGNADAYALRDTNPVVPLHTLILPRRHAETYFDLRQNEVAAVNDLLWALRADILAEDGTVQGFNIGVNVGSVAGQTIMHCHVHLIPRRPGDVEDPWGGVRAVIPGKARYPGAAE